MAYNLWSILQEMLIVDKKTLPTSFSEYFEDAPEEALSYKKAINSIILDLCEGEYPWKDQYISINTVANIQAYTSPIGLIDFIRHSGEYTDLRLVDYDAYILGRTDTGKPAEYGFKEGKIQLYPIPDMVYSLICKYSVSLFCKSVSGESKLELTDETDYPILPENCKDAIIYGALMKQYQKINRPKYQQYQKDFLRAKSRVNSNSQYALESKDVVFQTFETGWDV